MMTKTASIDLKRKSVAVIGLHPGTVKTEMSSPFSGNVKPDKLFTAD
jgi:NAD(P)-dependent dehydrogenase (short-subunit alcohol dehydrogenase family)